MKIAIVTGASSGIGRQFARTIKDHCDFDQVWAIARDKKKLNKLVKELPVDVRPISLDLGRENSYKKFKEMIEEEQPEIRMLINASGFGKFELTTESPVEVNLDMVNVNCKAVTALCQICIPHMSPNARIINIASVAALQPIPGINTYAATKAYVLYYTRALNQELKLQKLKIKAMAVCPFWTKTGFFDRAVSTEKEPLVKKYVAMYEPEQIVERAWRDMKLGKDVSKYGFKARAQAAMVKMLPHKLVMKIWMSQQNLRKYAK